MGLSKRVWLNYKKMEVSCVFQDKVKAGSLGNFAHEGSIFISGAINTEILLMMKD